MAFSTRRIRNPSTLNLPASVRSGRVTITTSISARLWREAKARCLHWSQLLETAINRIILEETGEIPNLNKLQSAIHLYMEQQKTMQRQIFKLQEENKELRRGINGGLI